MIVKVFHKYVTILTMQEFVDILLIKHPDGCFQERARGVIVDREESYDTSVITHTSTSTCLQ